MKHFIHPTTSTQLKLTMRIAADLWRFFLTGRGETGSGCSATASNRHAKNCRATLRTHNGDGDVQYISASTSNWAHSDCSRACSHAHTHVCTKWTHAEIADINSGICIVNLFINMHNKILDRNAVHKSDSSFNFPS